MQAVAAASGFIAMAGLRGADGLSLNLGRHMDLQIPKGGLKVSGPVDEWVSRQIQNVTKGKPSTRFGIMVNLPSLTKYGCWCYRGTDYPGGRGVTQDNFDDACKAHHMGYDCIIMDSGFEEPECIADSNNCCDPPNTPYLWWIAPVMGVPGKYTFECADEIFNNWCKRKTCQVDLRFLSTFYELTGQGLQPDYETYGHTGTLSPGFNPVSGMFDPATCPDGGTNPTSNVAPPIPLSDDVGTGGGGGFGGSNTIVVNNPPSAIAAPETATRTCCGEQPFRVWYNKYPSDDRSCCVYQDSDVNDSYRTEVNIGKMFHTGFEVCCADSGVISGSNVC